MTGENYVIREAHEGETEEIISLITENFWSNNPIFERYATVLKDRCPGGVEDFMKNKSQLARHKIADVTHRLVVVHEQSDKIVGYLGLSVYEKGPEDDAELDAKSRAAPVFESRVIAEYQAYLEPRIKKLNIHEAFPNAKRFMSLGSMAVDSHHRGRGLSEKLMREGLKWAEANEIQVVHGAFGTRYSQRPAEKIGFKTIKEYDIRDFRDSNGTQVFADATPNELVAVKAIALAES